MAEIERSALVEYSANQMFELVDNVEEYPKFLPWCGGASSEPQDEVTTHATVKINYHHIKHSFTTKNKRFPPELIEMSLLDGPFKHLDGHWQFIPISENTCMIKFRLNFTFSHKILEKLVGPVFHKIANSSVESFIERAKVIYEKR